MYQWEKQIQQMVDEIDTSIRAHNDDALTLSALSRRLGLPPHRVRGVRLPADYSGPVPEQMQLLAVPEGEYIVFEHGPFDYEQENRSVEEKIEKAMADFDYAANRFCLDTAPGRIMYFYYDPARYFKYIRPIKR